MWKYKITFKSASDTLSFKIESENKKLIEDFVYGFYQLFGDIKLKKVECLQRNDTLTQKGIFTLLDSLKSKFPPSINGLYSFFNKLDKNEYFLFLPEIELTAENSYKFQNLLISKKTKEPVEKLNEQFEKVFGKVLKNYEVEIAGSIRKHIGNRSKRICRFCNNDDTKTTFKQTAHAISEGLGNKKVFLYDECDTCNDKFSRELEPDIINYYSILRTFFDVKGKGGSKKIKGKEFEIENKEGVTIKFEGLKHRPDPKGNNYNLKLELLDKVNLQDIYRCLCKYVVSIIDKSHLIHLQKTIKWINKEISIADLPKIGELISYNHFTLEPQMFIYIRKTENKKMPHIVGELHLTCKILTFIVPLSEKDELKFITETEYKYFWRNLVNYNRTSGWAFNNFSNDTEREITFKLNTSIKTKK